jgi:flagellar biosynthesis/type III secretory pathway M-ring protein FliF/YscJ
MGYDVNLKSNGTIMVPEGNRKQPYMSMAELGYPKSGLNMIFIQEYFYVTTESEKKEYSRMALEDRLSLLSALLRE